MCVQHRRGDPGISAAPAEISAHALTDAFRIISGLPFLEQTDRAHNLARGTEPTLETVMGDEGCLDRMKFCSARDTFDREYIGTVVADSQRQT